MNKSRSTIHSLFLFVLMLLCFDALVRRTEGAQPPTAQLPRIPDDGLSAPPVRPAQVRAPDQAPLPRPLTSAKQPAATKINAADKKATPASQSTPLPIDLAYALRLVNASNPTIALAREQINEALAKQGQAAVLWIPNAWIGGNPHAPTFLPTFYHHDGQIQNSTGRVFDTVRSNFALDSGVNLDFQLADAIFAPRAARQATAAAQARSRAVTFDVQLDVALTYLELLRAFGALAITQETFAKAQQMLVFAVQADRAGLGKTTADANRARTEVELRRQELI
ncbi:MAG: hypothetical protein ACRD36_10655, partial [Candidatus Acidiferrum sp.]